jgi:L-lysine 2,3-aminomutase
MVDPGAAALARVHETRVELDCDATDDALDRAIYTMADDHRITDVVLHSRDDISRSFARLQRVLDRLTAVPNVSAVRLISPGLTFQPGAYSDALVKRLGACSRPGVVRPRRLELEICLLHPADLEPVRPTLIRALRQRGVSVYANIPLLTWVNDGEEELEQLTAGCRRLGIEVHHLYLAGHPIQQAWAAEHPVHAARVLDLASHLRRTGSGRELPRYIIRTPLGEVDLGTTCDLLETSDDGMTRVRLLAYDLAYYRGLDPGFEVPEGVELDEDEHPIVTITGLVV